MMESEMEESYWAVSVVEYKRDKFSDETVTYLNHEVYIVKAGSDIEARVEGQKLYSAESLTGNYALVSTRVKLIGKRK